VAVIWYMQSTPDGGHYVVDNGTDGQNIDQL